MLSEQEAQKLADLKELKEKEGVHFHPTYQHELEILMAKENLNTPVIEEEAEKVEEEESQPVEVKLETPEIEGGDSNGQEESTGEKGSEEASTKSNDDEKSNANEGENAQG